VVPKWVTLNDFERRNSRYFALFHRNRDIWGQLRHCDKNVAQRIRFWQYVIYGDILGDR